MVPLEIICIFELTYQLINYLIVAYEMANYLIVAYELANSYQNSTQWPIYFVHLVLRYPVLATNLDQF